MADRCESCRFFRRLDGREIGDCQRFPPRIVECLIDEPRAFDADDIMAATIFPVVLCCYTCGEYRRAESASGVPIVRAPPPGTVIEPAEGELPPVLQRAVSAMRRAT